MTNYHVMSSTQMFFLSILISIISSALIVINIYVKDYLLLPVVMPSAENCIVVKNFRNGDAYTCNDVGSILRKYRIKTE